MAMPLVEWIYFLRLHYVVLDILYNLLIIRLDNYFKRKKGISAVDCEMMDLTKFEQKLAELQEVVEIRGKVSIFCSFTFVCTKADMRGQIA